MSPWGPLTDGAPNCSRKRHEGGWFQKKTSLIRRRHGVDGMLVERHGRVAGYRIGKDQSAGMPDSLQPGPAAGQDHRSQLRVKLRSPGVRPLTGHVREDQALDVTP